MVKAFCLQCGRPRFHPWVGKIPWRRKQQPALVFSPGKSHGWRSLAAYSPWGCKESDTTERLHFHLHKIKYVCVCVCVCVCVSTCWGDLMQSLIKLREKVPKRIITIN